MRSHARAMRPLVALVMLTTTLSCGGPDSTPPAAAVASITMSPTFLSLVPGQASQVTATPKDVNGAALTGRTLSWNSQNSAIATVSNTGLVTAVSDGVTQVTASVTGINGSAIVEVKTPVATVTITPPTSTVTIGGGAQLAASLKDINGVAIAGRLIAWSSSNSTIAEVTSSGMVTGISVGSAIITATSDGRSGTALVQVNAPNPCLTIQPVTIGQTVSGTLAASDCRLTDNSVIQKFEFTLAAITALEIEMTSTVIDPYLLITDNAGNIILEDDDGGIGINARILRTFTAGKYFVWANTYDANSYGAYQLTVRPAPAACITGRATVLPASVPATLAANTACRLNDDSYADRYNVSIAQRMAVRVDMTSSIVDPYLLIVDGSGKLVAQDDDAGAGTNAKIEVVLEPGQYVILANALPGQTGAYRLDVAPPIDPCAVTRTLVIGQTASGTLSASDCAINNNGPIPFTQRWALNVTSTAPLQFDMTSSAVDAYLIVQDATTGAIVAENDDIVAGQITNSRIIVSLAPGQYIVNASTFDFGEIGPYQLSATNVTPPQVVGITLNPPGALSLTSGQTQALTPTVTGTTNQAVTWTTTNSAVATVTTAGLVRAVTPGTATISARPVADPSKVATANVTVTQSQSANPNLDIGGLYLVQSVQQPDGSVRLISDRDAVARVFLRGSRTGIGTVTVRVRIFQGATLLGTFQGTTTPTLTVDENCCSANVLIPAAMIRAGNSVLADADPTDVIAESNETDNSFPVSGTAQALSVVTVPPFNIRLIPVRQSRSGLTGVANATLLNTLRSVWPMGTVNLTIRQQFTTDYAINGNSFDEWGQLVRDIELARRAEGTNSYYYGLLRVNYTSGVLGLANGIPALSAIGVDEGTPFGATEARFTFAHEMGHTLGLRHAPCGGAAGPDPGYPFADGRTGAFGMDIASGNVIKVPTGTDMMTYCDNQWVSVYNYKNVMDFRIKNPNGVTGEPATAAATSVLMITGSMDKKAVNLDGSFSMNAIPTNDDPTGRFVIEGFSEQGQRLFAMRFSPFRIEDGHPDNEAFVLAVPASQAVQNQLVRVAVRELGGGRIHARTKNTLASLRAQQTPAVTSRRVAGITRVRWSTVDHPMVVVRDQRTGEVIGVSRSGDLNLSQFGALGGIELLITDGVTSARHTIDPVSGAIRE